MVADMEKFGSTDAGAMTMAAIDAGIVTENACVAAAGLGLAIVPRASMDAGQIRKILGLSDKQIPLMNTPIGYFKGKALAAGFSHDVDSIKVEVSTMAGSHHVLLTSDNEAVVMTKDNSRHTLPAQETERLKALAEKLFVSKSEPVILSEEKASGRTDHPIFTVTVYCGGKEENTRYEMGTEDNGITRCTAKNIRYSDSFRELMCSVLSYAGLGAVAATTRLKDGTGLIRFSLLHNCFPASSGIQSPSEIGIIQVPVFIVLFRIKILHALSFSLKDEPAFPIDKQLQEGHGLPGGIIERLGGEPYRAAVLPKHVQGTPVIGVHIHVPSVPKQQVELIACGEPRYQVVEQAEAFLRRQRPSQLILSPVYFVDEIVEYALAVGLPFLYGFEGIKGWEVEDGAVVGKRPRPSLVVVLHKGMAVLVRHAPYACQADVGNHVVNLDGMFHALAQILALVGAEGFLLQRYGIAIEEGKPPSVAMIFTVGEKLPEITVYGYSFAAAKAEYFAHNVSPLFTNPPLNRLRMMSAYR